ncbi:MAG: tetratricopeptide repeat protein [Candidimonas sp.]|jgi:type III secretion system low calcium response chaperone LcrH/SycD
MTKENTVKTQGEGRSTWAQTLYDELNALPSASRLSNEQLEVIYAMGYTHLTQRQYDQALSFFLVLSLYGATRRHYLMGLAYCLQMLERYDEAIDKYSLALVLHPKRYDAALRIVECYLALENLEEARSMLGWLEEIDRASPQGQPWGGKVKALREVLGAKRSKD